MRSVYLIIGDVHFYFGFWYIFKCNTHTHTHTQMCLYTNFITKGINELTCFTVPCLNADFSV